MNSAIIPYQIGSITIPVRKHNRTVWLSQKQIGELFDLARSNVANHIANFKADNPDANQYVLEFEHTADDGKVYRVIHYSLDVVLYAGFRAQRSDRVIAFRKWVADVIEERLSGVQQARLLERQNFEGVKGLIYNCVDYDPKSKQCHYYFAVVQNKLLYAVTGCTAADLIATRVSHVKPNLGLQTWKADDIKLTDAQVGKNYLTEAELKSLAALVNTLYLLGERYRVTRGKMHEWINAIDQTIELFRYEQLKSTGRYTADEAKRIAKQEYQEFKTVLFEQQQPRLL